MAIRSVRAAPVTDPTALGRSAVDEASEAGWQTAIDHMNPLADDPRYRGQAERFAPPWSDVICVVTADDGEWGVGMTALAGLTVPLINQYLAPMLTGDDEADIGRLWTMMATACGAHFGTAGPAAYAISAVDLALWDLAGRRAGRPAWSLIAERAGVAGGSGDGGDQPPTRARPVPCYATGLDVARYAELGIGAVKLACPWGPDRSAAVDRTVELIETTRSAVGPAAEIMLDCWAVNAVDDAVAIGEAVEPYRLGWIEDYLFPEDWPGYRQVRQRLPDSTLAAGERWYTDRPFAHALAEGWVDVVQPDALWIGGATPTIEVARLAARAGSTLALHCGANDGYGQHLSSGLATNTWAELYIGASAGPPGDPVPLDELVADAYRSTPGMAVPVDGTITATDAPGFGIELTFDDIERATRQLHN